MFLKSSVCSLLFLTHTVAGASANELDRIRASGELTVATEADFPPFEFIQDGKVMGFGQDLLDEVAKDLALEVRQLNIPFQNLFSDLEAEEFDLVATSVVVTPERAKKYAFTKPFAEIEIVVLVDADNQSINSDGDLSGAIVATQEASATEPVAQEIADHLANIGKEKMELVLTPTYGAAVSLLRDEEVDAVIIGGLTAREFMEEDPDQFRVSFTYGDPVHLAWVVRQSSTELLAEIDETILRLEESGELSEMQERWLGESFKAP